MTNGRAKFDWLNLYTRQDTLRRVHGGDRCVEEGSEVRPNFLLQYTFQCDLKIRYFREKVMRWYEWTRGCDFQYSYAKCVKFYESKCTNDFCYCKLGVPYTLMRLKRLNFSILKKVYAAAYMQNRNRHFNFDYMFENMWLHCCNHWVIFNLGKILGLFVF